MNTPDDPSNRTVHAHLGAHGYGTEIEAGPHGLIADEPAAVGGADEGPSPYDLLLAALGACKTITMRMYASRKGWPLEGATVTLRRRKAAPDGEGRTDVIETGIHLQGSLTDEQRARLEEIADRCPVHRTLEAGVVFEKARR